MKLKEVWHGKRTGKGNFHYQRIPKDSSLETIIDKLRFVEMVEKGIEDLESVKVIPEEEAKKVLAKWLK